MNKTNTLNTISDLIMHMYGLYSDGESIKALSEHCNVPIKFVRKFILSLLNHPIISNWISSKDFHDKNDPDNTINEAFRDHERAITKAILSGKCDNWRWKIDLYGVSSEYLLSLTALEYASIKDLGEADFLFNPNSVFEIKNNLAKKSNEIRSNLDEIQKAIDNKQAIEFSYKQKDGTFVLKRGYPIEIFTNVSDNWTYFSLENGDFCRLDKVKSLYNDVENCGSYPESTSDPYIKYVWGSSYKNSDKPEHVKVRIEDATRNILQKIRNDTRHRSGICKFYEKDGKYYYEDDIIGMNEFKRWLRSFGSSVQVLEPQYVRDDMIKSAEIALEYYAASEEWKGL